MQNQGEGIDKMFLKLPKGYSATDVAAIMNSIANYKRAESFVKAIETGKVGTIVYEGQGARIQ
jgi:hypothetical protein